MNAKQKIQAEIKRVHSNPVADVRKATDYVGAVPETGWWYFLPDHAPIFLGKNESSAIEFLGQFGDAGEL